MSKAVIFDMDGVMYDTERITTSIWLKVSQILGFKLTREQCDYFRGSNNDFKRKLFKKWYGDTVDVEEILFLKQQLLEKELLENGVPIKKGLFELMTELKNKNYKIAIATSTLRKKAEQYWNSTAVLEYIDETVCGDEVTKSKPDPQIFCMASQKLEVPIKECIIIEDSLNGLKAARLSGGTVVMVPDMTPPNEELEKICDYIFNSLDEVISIIK